MILEEGGTIKLANGTEYYVIDDIGELEGYEGKHYVYAIGITKEGKFNKNDYGFLELVHDDKGYIVTKIPKNTEIYETLEFLETVHTKMETEPGFKEKLMKEFK